MAHREATLNAWDAQLWLQIPVALAEVGSRLNASNADYLGRLLELLEDAVALATALALARLTAERPLSDSLQRAAREQLERPSLGKRLALLSQIHAEHPGAAGWDLDSAAEDCDGLFALGRGGSPRRPRIRDVFDTLTTIRNDEAHRRLAQARREEVARAVERAVFNLVRSNVGFHQRILLVEEVRVISPSEREITARSLSGPGATSYRRGHWQPVGAQQVLPNRVYLGDTDALVDAHPFLVCRGERLYVLGQLRSSRPVRRHFSSREELKESLATAWSARFPEPQAPDGALETAAPPRWVAPPAPPRAHVVAPATSSSSGLGLPAWLGLALLGLGVVAVAVALVMGAVTFYAERPSTRDRPAAPSPPVDPPGCRGPSRRTSRSPVGSHRSCPARRSRGEEPSPSWRGRAAARHPSHSMSARRTSRRCALRPGPVSSRFRSGDTRRSRFTASAGSSR